LVTLAIVGAGPALADVRRQRHLTVSLQQREGVAGGIGPGQPVPAVAPREGQPQRPRLDHHGLANGGTAARLAEQLPRAVQTGVEEQALPPAAGAFAPADEAGRHDAGVVENKEVAGVEQFGQVGEGAVF
jgi:hypothetical protein